jgi:hypothetical protein
MSTRIEAHFNTNLSHPTENAVLVESARKRAILLFFCTADCPASSIEIGRG